MPYLWCLPSLFNIRMQFCPILSWGDGSKTFQRFASVSAVHKVRFFKNVQPLTAYSCKA
jgi:hypothetical protein